MSSSLNLERLQLRLPSFFTSISSLKDNLQVCEYLRLFEAFGHQQFLISAYDILRADESVQTEIVETVTRLRDAGCCVLLDSGNYESYWYRDRSWKEEDFIQILGKLKPDIAFAFDLQDLTGTAEEIAEKTVSSFIRQSEKAQISLIPILHADAAICSDVAAIVAQKLNPLVLGIPERGLGSGIVERARTLNKVRKRLDMVTEQYTPIHLLGTGNPLSLLIYAHCGADLFDGLEWCRTTVDHETARLHHFQHYDLFAHQTKFLESGIGFVPAGLAHNLSFYRNWMDRIADAKGNGDLFSLVSTQIPDNMLQKFVDAIPEIRWR